MQNQDFYVEKCREIIEQKLDWGGSEYWQNQDFELLSERIFDETKVSLSSSTLKRVWGKVRYDSTPNVATLNVLAKFSGYENWREFLSKEDFHQNKPLIFNSVPDFEKEKIVYKKKEKVRVPLVVKWIVIPVMLIGVGLLVFAFFFNSEKINPERFSFSSQPVTKGIPNSVVFHYDATASNSDSVFIQQSWDGLRRFPVPKDRHEYTSIYFYPGYYKAKLIIGQQVVKEHDLYIPSDGWLAAIDQQPVPVYLKKEEFLKNGILEVSSQTIESYNVSMQPKTPFVKIYNVQDFKGLKDDNFTFETTLKNDFKLGAAVCQRLEILLLCENDVIVVPLAAKGCVGDLSVYAAGKSIDAKEADLSDLGCNLSDWTSVKIKSVNKNMEITVNEQKPVKFTFPNPPSKIVGLLFRFEGTPSIKKASFKDADGKLVFADGFQ